MRKYLISILLIVFFSSFGVFANEVVGTGDLKITIEKLSQGAKIISIKNGDVELMDITPSSTMFLLDISGVFVTSSSGWDSVEVINDGTNSDIIFSKPKSGSGLSSLTIVKVSIDVAGRQSDWHISVEGLNSKTLNNVVFPYVNILAPGNDYFLTPKYSGKLYKNPKNGISATLFYPRGWSSTMQFCAYYNDNYGIYLGTHDPAASVKYFSVKNNNNNGLLFKNEVKAPNRGTAGNDYEMSGVFHFKIFEGNWYDAAQIYKKWASEEADYWPKDTEERKITQEIVGNIAVWGRYYSVKDAATTLASFKSFRNYFDVPMGLHWYNWNYSYFDDNYPIYFPERPGMSTIIEELKKDGTVHTMPYINGRLFETNLDIYPTLGKPAAAKKSNGAVIKSSFIGNSFANMCPTQRQWQDILIDAADQIVNRIGNDAVYIDQVTAAGPLSCYDPTHGHTLGSGHYWRDGYFEMLSKMKASTPVETFLSTEGCNDYLADVVDVFLTDGWATNNLVPAFQAVYSGKVQLMGTRFGTSTYNSPVFYCKFSQAFINGIQPGRFYIGMEGSSSGALPFARQMARMRNKLNDFMAFGSLKKPIFIDRSSIPTITTTWKDYAYDVPVTISALQYSFWENSDGDKVALVFANASMTQALNFTVNFNGVDNGLIGSLGVQKITENTDGDIVMEGNSFTRNLVIQPKKAFALIITPDSTTAIDDVDNKLIEYKLGQNYPNPFNPATEINFTIPSSGQTNLLVYNVLGQQVVELVNKELNAGEYKVKFNGADLPSGLYFYKLQSNNYLEIKKMILLK